MSDKTTTRTRKATVKRGNVTVRKTVTISKTVKAPKGRKRRKK